MKSPALGWSRQPAVCVAALPPLGSLVAERVHGVAVACGLALALEASERAGLLEDRSLRARLDALLRTLELPRSLGELRRQHGPLPAADLLAAMRHDKKASSGRPAFVLPRAAGSIELAVPLDDAAVLALLA